MEKQPSFDQILETIASQHIDRVRVDCHDIAGGIDGYYATRTEYACMVADDVIRTYVEITPTTGPLILMENGKSGQYAGFIRRVLLHDVAQITEYLRRVPESIETSITIQGEEFTKEMLEAMVQSD